MAFTACTTGAVALYSQENETLLALPVEAWDETGAAYVAGIKGLILADTRPGFLRLEQAAVIVPPKQEVKQPVRGERPGPRPGPREREARA